MKIMPNFQQTEALRRAAAAAIAAERETGCPAEASVAQWIEESGWGARAPGNNPFGMKEYPGCAGRQLLATHEWFTAGELAAFLDRGDGRDAVAVRDGRGQPLTNGSRARYAVHDWFAAFPSLEDAFAAHGRMLTTGNYAQAFEAYKASGSLEEFVRAIAPIYATSAGYADGLLRLMLEPAVSQAIAAARGNENTGRAA